MRALITWKIRAEHLATELALLAEVYHEMNEKRPEELGYSTFQIDDGVWFIAMVDMPQGMGVLSTLPAFQKYRASLDSRCEILPVVRSLKPVELYDSVTSDAQNEPA